MRRSVLLALLVAVSLPLALEGAASGAAAQGYPKQKAGFAPKGMPAKGPATKGQGELRPGPLPWVDMHMHLVPARGDFSGAVAEALRLMDRAGISTAVVMPTPQSPPSYSEREYVQILRRHPGRFVWFGGGGDLNHIIHRTDPGKVTGAVQKDFAAKAEAILDAGARGFGEMAVLHISMMAGHPFEETRADHPLYLALADVAGARGAVISMHIDLVPTDGPTPAKVVALGNPRRLRGNVAGFERLLAHNRKARFVLEHVGADPVGHASLELLSRLVDQHSNLYLAIRAAPGTSTDMQNLIVDTKGILPEWREFFVRRADRFLFGTDSFMVAPGAGSGPGVSFAARNVNKLILHNRILAALPPEVARKIAIDNPRALLGLPAP